MVNEITIYVADAGSASQGNFHWVSSRDVTVSAQDALSLAQAISGDLACGNPVALGYECPLFIPVEDDPALLGLRT